MTSHRGTRIGRTLQLLLLCICCIALAACGLARNEVPSPTPKQAQRVVNAAYSQMGKKYRLGGASPSKGFDCSGLVWWAYRQGGVKVPRITTDQAKSGQSVPRAQAQPGDIVVFRTSASPRGLHTGIFAGGSSFIHSPRNGEKVRMESINTKYWKSKLVSVRRVLR